MFWYFQEPSPKSLNELNQLLEALSTAKETMKNETQSKFEENQLRNNQCGVLARTARASSLTPTTSIPTIDESSQKNAKSIDDLIESLNTVTETTKSSARKKYDEMPIFLNEIQILFDRSSSASSKHSSKKSTATKELEDLMESLSNFNLPLQVRKSLYKIYNNFWIFQRSSSTRVPPRSSSSSEQISTTKTSPTPQQYPLCHSCQKPIIGQVLILKPKPNLSSINTHFQPRNQQVSDQGDGSSICFILLLILCL